MAKVNRYTRPTQVARFNPLSTQQVMAVPLAKQALEDTQADEANKYLNELYNMRATGPDAPRIEARKKELMDEMNELVSDISSNGVSIKNTQRLRKLKDKYAKELSATGDIGHANNFVAMREAARKEFMANKAHQARGMDWISEYWDKNTANISAFNEDGSYKTEFDTFGLPDVTDPIAQFHEAAKQLGATAHYFNGQIVFKGNEDQLRDAAQAILNKYRTPGTMENRDMIVTYGSEEEGLKVINEQLMRMIGASTLEATGQMAVSAGSSTAGKRPGQAATEKDKNLYEEQTLSSTSTQIIGDTYLAPSIQEIEKQILEQQFALETNPQDKEAANILRRLYHDLETVDEQVRQTDAGKRFYETREKAFKALPKELATNMENDQFYDVSLDEKGRVVVTDRTNIDPDNPYQGVIKLYKGTEEEIQKVKDYITADFNYQKLANQMIGDEKTHRTFPAESYIGSTNKDLTKTWEVMSDNLFKGLKNSPGSYRVMGRNIMEDNKLLGSNKIVTYDKTDQDVGNENFLTALNQGEDFEITNIVRPTATTPLRVQVKFNYANSNKSGNRVGTETSWIEIDNEQGQYLTDIFTSRLSKSNNGDLQGLAKSIASHVKYKDVIPAAAHRDNNYWTNSDRIKEYYDSNQTDGTLGAWLLSGQDKADIYQSENGAIRMKVAKGEETRDLTYGDLVSVYNMFQNDNTLSNKEHPAVVDTIERIVKDPTINLGENTPMPNPNNYIGGRESADFREDYAEWVSERYTKLSNSNIPIETNDHYELFQLLE